MYADIYRNLSDDDIVALAETAVHLSVDEHGKCAVSVLGLDQ